DQSHIDRHWASGARCDERGRLRHYSCPGRRVHCGAGVHDRAAGNCRVGPCCGICPDTDVGRAVRRCAPQQGDGIHGQPHPVHARGPAGRAGREGFRLGRVGSGERTARTGQRARRDCSSEPRALLPRVALAACTSLCRGGHICDCRAGRRDAQERTSLCRHRHLQCN
ncbi:hypothetical protein H4R21_005856, partial [Coemansia helicoidea]